MPYSLVQALILTNNKITELKHIKHLGGLTTLVLGKNLLSQLPSLSGLAALNKLTLYVPLVFPCLARFPSFLAFSCEPTIMPLK